MFGKNRQNAFTLVELLVVIAIITILLTMLFPALKAAREAAYMARVQARITELDMAVRVYKSQYGFYPGQQDPSSVFSGSNQATGSQLLAEAMFIDYDEKNWDGGTNGSRARGAKNSWKWKTKFASLQRSSQPSWPNVNPRDDFRSACNSMIQPSVSENFSDFTVSDRYGSNPMPILYFPARLDVSGVGQFVESDNRVYFPTPNPYNWGPSTSILDFGNYIRDTRFGPDTPYYAGEFLLIAANKDRKYGLNGPKNWSEK